MKPLMLKAPMPYFGGKLRAAAEIWREFGDCENYTEPFAGSLAVLLQRPHEPRTETVNDLCGFISNFWRAIRDDPEGVAQWADQPVSERDLEAQHFWLMSEGAKRLTELMADPEASDSKFAGAWLVLHGSLSPSVASQVAQIITGAGLVLGASALHALRCWIDAQPQFAALRGVVDQLDAAVGETVTAEKTTQTTATGKELFVEVAANHAVANGTKSA